MDLPLSAPLHLSITRVTKTLMTLIMCCGHMARLCVCVCVCRPEKQIALEMRPSSWSPPWDSHCRGYTDRGNMAVGLGGGGGVTVMDSLHLLRSVSSPDVPFCPGKSGREGAGIAIVERGGHRMLRLKGNSSNPLNIERVHLCDRRVKINPLWIIWLLIFSAEKIQKADVQWGGFSPNL